jgi:hypothetical protein
VIFAVKTTLFFANSRIWGMEPVLLKHVPAGVATCGVYR